jgi:hypothetical protein
MDNRATSLVEAVDGSRLMGHCAEFARWVKLSGSADELSSMHTVQAALDSYGYRTTLLKHEAYISLPGEAAVTVDGVNLTAITHSFGVASPPDGLSATLAFVGEGGAA